VGKQVSHCTMWLHTLLKNILNFGLGEAVIVSKTGDVVFPVGLHKLVTFDSS
jgi:hypothetical protein